MQITHKYFDEDGDGTIEVYAGTIKLCELKVWQDGYVCFENYQDDRKEYALMHVHQNGVIDNTIEVL